MVWLSIPHQGFAVCGLPPVGPCTDFVRLAVEEACDHYEGIKLPEMSILDPKCSGERNETEILLWLEAGIQPATACAPLTLQQLPPDEDVTFPDIPRCKRIDASIEIECITAELIACSLACVPQGRNPETTSHVFQQPPRLSLSKSTQKPTTLQGVDGERRCLGFDPPTVADQQSSQTSKSTPNGKLLSGVPPASDLALLTDCPMTASDFFHANGEVRQQSMPEAGAPCLLPEPIGLPGHCNDNDDAASWCDIAPLAASLAQEPQGVIPDEGIELQHDDQTLHAVPLLETARETLAQLPARPTPRELPAMLDATNKQFGVKFHTTIAPSLYGVVALCCGNTEAMRDTRPGNLAARVTESAGRRQEKLQLGRDPNEQDVMAALKKIDVPMLPWGQWSVSAGRETGHDGSIDIGVPSPLAAFPEAFRFTFIRQALHECHEERTDMQNDALFSLWELVAKEMAPQDGLFMLPPVNVPRAWEDAGEIAPNNPHPLTTAVDIEPHHVSSIATSASLYLDWSLSSAQPSLRPAELLAACVATKAELYSPRFKPLLATPTSKPPTRSQAALVSAMLRPFELHHATKSADTEGHSRQPQGKPSLSGALQGSNQENDVNRHYDSKLIDALAASSSKPRAKTRCFDGPPAPPITGLRFLMQLQGQGATRSGIANKADSEASKDSNNGESLSCLPPFTPTLQAEQVELPPKHCELFNMLKEEDAKLLAGIASEVTACGIEIAAFPALDALSLALQAASAEENQEYSVYGKQTVCALAGMAVLRQGAVLLVHHGLRSASMYLMAGAQELPHVVGISRLMQAMQHMEAAVSSGELEDHPKHAALRRTLAAHHTLYPDAKMLIAGEPRSFFTLYPIIRALGLRPCHVDRDGELSEMLNATDHDETVKQALQDAVANACEVADVVLASAEAVAAERIAAAAAADGCRGESQHATRGIFPLQYFQNVVVYCSEEHLQQAVIRSLQDAQVAITAYQVTLPLSVTNVPRDNAETGAVHVSPQQHPQQVSTVEKRPGSSVPAMPSPKLPPCATIAAGPDWPLVVSSSPGRPLRTRRALHEAVLSIERRGGIIIERDLDLIDMVLSASAALSIVSMPRHQPGPGARGEHSANVQTTLEEFLQQAMLPLVQAVSYAFSKLHVVIEVNPDDGGMQAQLPRGLPRLVALGGAHGLNLQCMVVSSVQASTAVVMATADAYLHAWQEQRDGAVLYSIGDPPSHAEAFLAAFPCLNPHSAALLASCGLSLRGILRCKDPSQLRGAQTSASRLAAVPARSLELLTQFASFGGPLVATTKAGLVVQDVIQKELEEIMQAEADAEASPSFPQAIALARDDAANDILRPLQHDAQHARIIHEPPKAEPYENPMHRPGSMSLPPQGLCHGSPLPSTSRNDGHLIPPAKRRLPEEGFATEPYPRTRQSYHGELCGGPGLHRQQEATRQRGIQLPVPARHPFQVGAHSPPPGPRHVHRQNTTAGVERAEGVYRSHVVATHSMTAAPALSWLGPPLGAAQSAQYTAFPDVDTLEEPDLHDDASNFQGMHTQRWRRTEQINAPFSPVYFHDGFGSFVSHDDGAYTDRLGVSANLMTKSSRDAQLQRHAAAGMASAGMPLPQQLAPVVGEIPYADIHHRCPQEPGFRAPLDAAESAGDVDEFNVPIDPVKQLREAECTAEEHGDGTCSRDSIPEHLAAAREFYDNDCDLQQRYSLGGDLPGLHPPRYLVGQQRVPTRAPNFHDNQRELLDPNTRRVASRAPPTAAYNVHAPYAAPQAGLLAQRDSNLDHIQALLQSRPEGFHPPPRQTRQLVDSFKHLQTSARGSGWSAREGRVDDGLDMDRGGGHESGGRGSTYAQGHDYRAARARGGYTAAPLQHLAAPEQTSGADAGAGGHGRGGGGGAREKSYARRKRAAAGGVSRGKGQRKFTARTARQW